jgi:hypothetical protein
LDRHLPGTLLETRKMTRPRLPNEKSFKLEINLRIRYTDPIPDRRRARAQGEMSPCKR